MIHLPGRSASQVTRDYRAELDFGSTDSMNTRGGRTRILHAPCSSVDLFLPNSSLQGVARQNEVNVAVKIHKIIDRREDQIGAGKRPAPIETDAVMWTGTRQLEDVVHTDRVVAARRDRQRAGVVIHELVYAAIAIGRSALDQVVGANLRSSIRFCLSIDYLMTFACAGDGDSSRQQGALVGRDGERHCFRDHLMIGGRGRCGRRDASEQHQDEQNMNHKFTREGHGVLLIDKE